MFRSARIKLTCVYTLAIALVMAAFSVALYLALSTAMASKIEVPETASPRVERAILEAQLARARLALVGVNVAGWIVAAAGSYVVAGRTLAPLESALVRQREFTAHASHELRTPLTVIKGEIDVTRARERSSDEYLETLDRVDAEVTHLEGVVGDLLTLARMEAGQNPMARRQGNVAAVIRDVLVPFRSGLMGRGIDLKVEVPRDLEAVLDWPRIRQLLVNLLDNAIQHTPPDGEISIAADQRGKYLDLTVFNSGSTIDPADLPHLFVPFYRGKESDPEAGTGLGLALCAWIVRTHHGTIGARNIGGGVAFDVRLPRE